jgi:DNA-binding response OmpR family regulator
MAEKILIVDDEADIREILACNLEVAGYEVDEASSAEEALDKLDDTHSLILLDIMMEGMNGYHMADVVRKERKSDIPIIFLTAKDQENDLLTGFARGGDDYITKPFSLQEVLARVKAVLRRKTAKEPDDAKLAETEVINIGGITIDRVRKIVIANGEELKLSPKELGILVTLCAHPGRVFSREEILDAVWHGESFVLSRTIDVHITRIRKKLGEAGDHITNRQGYGYCFEA